MGTDAWRFPTGWRRGALATSGDRGWRKTVVGECAGRPSVSELAADRFVDDWARFGVARTRRRRSIDGRGRPVRRRSEPSQGISAQNGGGDERALPEAI